MIAEEVLINYGVLGAWTIYLLYEKRALLKQLTETIQKNTDVLININKKFKNLK